MFEIILLLNVINFLYSKSKFRYNFIVEILILGGFLMSYADEVFIQNCTDILENGYLDETSTPYPVWDDDTPARTIKKFCIVNRYDLSKEFPIITLRKTAFKKCIDEILWIWQKKSNNIKDLNSHIWDKWADENGSIGKCYGYQLGIKHKYAEGIFDQVDRVIYDLKHEPTSRRILTNIYNHHDLYEMGIYPCAYSMTFNVTGNKLNAILNQRSQDFLTANNWNVCQYAILVHMLARECNLEAGEFVHVIADAHIYNKHIPIVKDLIKEKSYRAPVLKINPDVKNFYDFTVDDFELIDYKTNDKKYSIPVASWKKDLERNNAKSIK